MSVQIWTGERLRLSRRLMSRRGLSDEQDAQNVSPGVRERAVRTVREHRDDRPSPWPGDEAVAPNMGRVSQTFHTWDKSGQVDTDERDDIATSEREPIRVLECERKALRKVNEVLKLARGFLPCRNSTAV